MEVPMKVRSVVLLVTAVALLAACSSAGSSVTSQAGSSPSGDHGSMSAMPGMGDPEDFSFGEPADASSADRTVQVALQDELRFDPSSIDVRMSETINFEVTNEGQTAHEFVLGDESYQSEHEMSMGQMSGSLPPDEPNALVLQPGETKSLAWTFTEPGEILYGCHVAGHYEGGMVGTVTVEG